MAKVTFCITIDYVKDKRSEDDIRRELTTLMEYIKHYSYGIFNYDLRGCI